MNVFVPLFVVVAVCWFLVYTGRVAPTDPLLLLSVGGAVASGAVFFFLYAYVRAGRARADEMRRVAEGLGWEFAERLPARALPGADRFQIFAGEVVRGEGEGSPRPPHSSRPAKASAPRATATGSPSTATAYRSLPNASTLH